jgi:high frequency lysogenization protein
LFSKPTRQQALALAAVFQSCELVYQLGYSGRSEADQMAFAMSTLLNQNPDSLRDLYGSVGNLRSGITIMQDFLSDNKNAGDGKNREVINYVMSSIHLAGKLAANREMLRQIDNGIDKANQQALHFSATHENVCTNVAALYQDTISTMRLRIQVLGSGVYLQQAAVAARIRCMLFAAIRNAFLWRQLGGKRRHLLLQRKVLLKVLADD